MEIRLKFWSTGHLTLSNMSKLISHISIQQKIVFWPWLGIKWGKINMCHKIVIEWVNNVKIPKIHNYHPPYSNRIFIIKSYYTKRMKMFIYFPCHLEHINSFLMYWMEIVLPFMEKLDQDEETRQVLISLNNYRKSNRRYSDLLSIESDLFVCRCMETYRLF